MVLYANYLNAVVNIRNISEKGNTNYFILFECSSCFFFSMYFCIILKFIIYSTRLPFQSKVSPLTFQLVNTLQNLIKIYKNRFDTRNIMC